LAAYAHQRDTSIWQLRHPLDLGMATTCALVTFKVIARLNR
jgi:hypothetical protein